MTIIIVEIIHIMFGINLHMINSNGDEIMSQD